MTFTVNSKFEALSLSHYGYDGGNLKGSIWVCGLEWGGGISTDDLLKDINEGPIVAPRSVDNIEERLKYLNHQFDRKVFKIMAVASGREVSEHQDLLRENNAPYTSTGNVFKLNLYPISFKDTSSEHWTKEHFELTGFPTKELYMGWVQQFRFKFFNNLVLEHKPKVILGVGSNSTRDFLMAFGGIEALFTNHIDEIEIKGKQSLKVFSSAINPETKIIISPFLGNRHGISSDLECEIVGKLIQKYLGKN